MNCPCCDGESPIGSGREKQAGNWTSTELWFNYEMAAGERPASSYKVIAVQSSGNDLELELMEPGSVQMFLAYRYAHGSKDVTVEFHECPRTENEEVVKVTAALAHSGAWADQLAELVREADRLWKGKNPPGPRPAIRWPDLAQAVRSFPQSHGAITKGDVQRQLSRAKGLNISEKQIETAIQKSPYSTWPEFTAAFGQSRPD